MVFIIGGYASGKHEFAHCKVSCNESDIFTITDVIVSDYEKKSDVIFDIITSHRVVIATEIGSGLIPMDEKDRAHREAAGRLYQRIAKKADCVVRMVCGIAQVIKGELE